MKTNGSAKNIKGKLAGLTALEAVFYILSFPVIIILAAVFGVETYKLMPYYSFWPFVGTILIAVFALIFLIVALCVTRKKAKRPVRAQTVVLMVTVICLTSVVGVALDVVLPDILAKLTSATLFYEDVQNEYENQAEFNAGLVNEFIMLNLFNGNYDGEISYDKLKNDKDVLKSADGYDGYVTNVDNYYYEVFLPRLNPRQKELFDFVYEKYVMTDIEYCLKAPDVPGVGNSERICLALAIAEKVTPLYTRLAQEGFNNERIAYLFNNNYASMHQDGYVTFDDAFILYATSDRMTVPVVVRLLLDKDWTYSDNTPAQLIDGKVVEPEGSYFFELNDDATVLALEEAGLIEWDSENARGIVTAELEGAEVMKGAVVVAKRDGGGVLTGGWLRQPMRWGILDMDGKNMDVAAIDNLTLDLAGLISSIAPDFSDIINAAGGILKLDSVDIGELFDVLDGLLGLASGVVPDLSGTSSASVVQPLLDAVTEVIKEATDGKALHLGIAVNDEGALTIAVRPTNVEKGMLGYQYMTWLQSNNLLVAVMSVMSLRNWLFIFGAVSVFMVFAAGCCREYKQKLKEEQSAE